MRKRSSQSHVCKADGKAYIFSLSRSRRAIYVKVCEVVQHLVLRRLVLLKRASCSPTVGLRRSRQAASNQFRKAPPRDASSAGTLNFAFFPLPTPPLSLCRSCFAFSLSLSLSLCVYLHTLACRSFTFGAVCNLTRSQSVCVFNGKLAI